MDQDYMASYRSIQSKLRKRFLRKPNYPEAANQLHQLQQLLRGEHAPDYAAFCALAASRCEQAMNNPLMQAGTLVKTAQLYLEAEYEERQLMKSDFEGNMLDGLNCYEQAIKLYLVEGLSTYAGTLYTEMANVAKVFGHPEAALQYHFRAASLLSSSPLSSIQCLTNALQCQLELRQYDGSLDTLLKLVDTIIDSHDPSARTADGDPFLLAGRLAGPGAYRQTVNDAEVTAVLLYFALLEERPGKAKLLHAPVQRFLSDSDEFVADHMAQPLELALRYLVACLDDGCAEATRSAQLAIEPHLSPFQKDLLHAVLALRGVVMSA
eukprot:TRINITY_DN6868_c0_g1_i7.p1 TRINITY_DN6868_c0_g1~~TRINITY_DN6868_c0_g1_i7.p1  ORF type:complete len:323 (+),score=81.66 TRINITY_DN6868_c0_g1_i7:90-1058(+)